jgi:hypothetical protein
MPCWYRRPIGGQVWALIALNCPLPSIVYPVVYIRHKIADDAQLSQRRRRRSFFSLLLFAPCALPLLNNCAGEEEEE